MENNKTNKGINRTTLIIAITSLVTCIIMTFISMTFYGFYKDKTEECNRLSSQIDVVSNNLSDLEAILNGADSANIDYIVSRLIEEGYRPQGATNYYNDNYAEDTTK